ncbi:MAG: xanthine dehydrogenase molybdopterin binding subunit [Bacteroidales bacterium]
MSKPLPHNSALLHVTGKSLFVSDLGFREKALTGHVVFSPHAHALIKKIGTSRALALPGVYAVVTARDIPGINQMGPVVPDEPCLAEEEVIFAGQAVALIAAASKEIAVEAEKLLNIEYQKLPAVTTIEQSRKEGIRLEPPRKIRRGDPEKALSGAPNKIKGTLHTGGQEHWYLETQASLAVPAEDGGMKVFSATQHPSETQTVVAEVLGLDRNRVTVEVKRMGGAFGGKETQANHVAAWSALLAHTVKKPVRLVLTRDEDQRFTGKRHRTLTEYEAGFDENGQLLALKANIHLDAGAAHDLTMAITERALFHIDNAYFIPNLEVTGNTWKTNLPSNTAFRGFGGPQGMAVIENVIDRIARQLGKDPFLVRKLNFYREAPANITHYGQPVENNRLPMLSEQLTESSDYFRRREAIQKFNKENNRVKRGLALTPVKFGISFTTSFLNQAGALVLIYRDGSVLVHHGGTEMGQGLNTKIRQITAAELGVPAEKITVAATSTATIPNTSATAASSGSDLNGMAVKNAIDKLKRRLSKVACKLVSLDESAADKVLFTGDRVEIPLAGKVETIPFQELVEKAWLGQVPLSATGFYRTPGLHYDREAGRGHPFHYFAFGMAVSEAEVDCLTGMAKIIRTDILHDVGRSLNERIDMGQIIGGFVQGLGWVTTEELRYDDEGHLMNHGPDTYKIPTIADIPKDFRVNILKGVPNPNTIRQSKAVGEPPFMLAFSAWLAIKDAISAVGDHRFEPEFALPATNEVILSSIRKIRQQMNERP